VIILEEIIKLFWETIEPFEITLGWNSLLVSLLVLSSTEVLLKYL
jgi:hypothetical protein